MKLAILLALWVVALFQNYATREIADSAADGFT